MEARNLQDHIARLELVQAHIDRSTVWHEGDEPATGVAIPLDVRITCRLLFSGPFQDVLPSDGWELEAYSYEVSFAEADVGRMAGDVVCRLARTDEPQCRHYEFDPVVIPEAPLATVDLPAMARAILDQLRHEAPFQTIPYDPGPADPPSCGIWWDGADVRNRLTPGERDAWA